MGSCRCGIEANGFLAIGDKMGCGAAVGAASSGKPCRGAADEAVGAASSGEARRGAADETARAVLTSREEANAHGEIWFRIISALINS